MCSPSAHWGREPGTLHVFFVAGARDTGWLRLAWANLRRGRRPPFPSPYYVTIGRATLSVRAR